MKKATNYFAILCLLAGITSQLRSEDIPARWTNTLGMIFVPIPNTVVRFCICETRRQDYEVFVREGHWGRVWPEQPDFEQGPTHPVVNVNWEDAKDFCIWLTQREQARGIISSNQVYRLPGDREWSFAAGIKKESGETAEKRHALNARQPTKSLMPRLAETTASESNVPAGNYLGRTDGFKFTAPVGSFQPNQLGVYDLGGNVWEWCMDSADDGRRHILRGASWANPPMSLSLRDFTLPDDLIGNFGLRCVLAESPSSL